jgi:glycogen synthase
VTQEYPPQTGWGGIGTYTHEMATGLARQGHRVVVLTRAVDTPSDQTRGGIRVVRVLPKFAFLNGVPVLYRLNKVLEGYRLAIALTLPKLVREENIDIVEVPGLHGEILINVLLNNLKVPHVVRLHSCFPKLLSLGYIKKGVRAFNSIWAERRMLARTHFFSAPSHFIAKEWCAYPTFRGKKVEVIPNPTDCMLFRPSSSKSLREDCGVLFVGRTIKSKGIYLLPTIIEGVLKMQKDARFTIVGNIQDRLAGETLSAKEWIISKLPLALHAQVHFRDWVKPDTLVDYYQSSQIVIVPTLYESFGYSCLEAMACGKAVVAHAVGGINEILEGEDVGVKVPVGESKLFIEAIVNLLRDPLRRQQLGQNARHRALDQYHTPIITRRMMAFYTSHLVS